MKSLIEYIKEEPSKLVNGAEFAKANLLKTKKFADK